MKSQEWKRYEKECKEFEKMIKQKEFHFSILCEMLKLAEQQTIIES